MYRLAVIAAGLLGATFAQAAPHVDHLQCRTCAAWNVPQKPFKVIGNTYYVGTRELSAMLVTSPKGHILLDGALPQSANQIRKNIEALGFKLRDVKYILNSHPHWDHDGAIAALQKASGATVVSSPAALAVLQAGTIGADDPQYDAKEPVHTTPVTGPTRMIADGGVLRLGPLALTAVYTPGHTPGGVSWTWQSCEAGKCYNVVYADSLNAVSMDGYRFSGDATHPGIADTFRQTIARIGALPCDVIVSVHPGFTDTMEKLARTTPQHNAFVDPKGCAAYAADASARLEKRLAQEQAEQR